MENITVIGAGSWGLALAYVLNKNNHNVTVWSYDINFNNDNKDIKITTDIIESTKETNKYILAVPSIYIRETIIKFKNFFHEEDLIINVSKGLDNTKQIILTEVIKELAPQCNVAVLSGPSHAEEVLKDVPTALVASAENLQFAEVVQDLFMNKNFRVYINMDLIGVELGGALKNIIAIASGISDGLGYGDNTKAALMTRGIAEITRLGVAMGSNPLTFNGLSGIGDLIVTCTSVHSRNRKAGELIAQGKKTDEFLKEIGMVVEGINTVQTAYNLSIKYNVSMPIVESMNDIIFNNKDVKCVVDALLNRNKNFEEIK